jgi:NAD(P)-dependent dehydrogenase (short-subunit alcohol dehydrogenase family)
MIPDQFNLAGKTALVTGCRRGAGKAMAVGWGGNGPMKELLI